MRERIHVDDLYGEAYQRGAEEGRLLAERVARQVYLRYLKEAHHLGPISLGELPIAAGERCAYFFRKRLVDYLVDKGDLILHHDGKLEMSPELAAMPITDEDTTKLSCEGYVLLAHLPDVAGQIMSGTDGFQAIGLKHGMGAALDRWVSAMVEIPVRVPGVIMTARALTQRLERGPCIVFEGGAGVGAVLRQALAIPRFHEVAANIEKYYFTDISPILLSIGRSWLRANAPAELVRRIRFEVHDLDHARQQTLVYTQDESVDVIILEMVLYDVANLREILTTFHKMLKSGGMLIFTMAYRQRPALFFPAEMLQSTLHSYYRAKLDPPLRVNCGYLTIKEWELSLRDAGFDEYHIYPQIELHSEFLFGGIVAFK
jgi:SAM-dependent methyltransferase